MTYGTAADEAGPGGRVVEVEPAGAAARAGLLPGDVVHAVDGLPVRDVLDWQWLTTGGSFEVDVTGTDGSPRALVVERSWDEPLGVSFASSVFDGIRTCENACTFCFVAQLQPGLRPALYVRDDDYRLSFLDGNFVTFTNVDEDDIARIVEQRLSPLHVSVHAVDPGVRRMLICPTGPDEALAHIDALVSAGIELHVQIVLVPGVNDGEILERTLEWLFERDTVISVGIVPLGFTSHQTRFASSFDASEATSVIDALVPWRARALKDRDLRWVYAADEFYLAAGRGVPDSDEYDGFPQYENGIGLVRAFQDEWFDGLPDALAAVGDTGGSGPSVVAVTGELFAPVLERLSRRLYPGTLRVLPVHNAFFGGNVSVSGLLTARDLVAAIRDSGEPGPFLVPDSVLNSEGVTLDDVAGSDLGELTGADVRVVSCDAAGLLDAYSRIRSAS